MLGLHAASGLSPSLEAPDCHPGGPHHYPYASPVSTLPSFNLSKSFSATSLGWPRPQADISFKFQPQMLPSSPVWKPSPESGPPQSLDSFRAAPAPPPTMEITNLKVGNLCTLMFRAAPFTAAKKQKEPRCPLTRGWMNTALSTYRARERSVFKKRWREFPLQHSRLRTQHSVCEDVGSTPGLTRGARIQHCHKLQNR